MMKYATYLGAVITQDTHADGVLTTCVKDADAEEHRARPQEGTFTVRTVART